MQKKSENFYNEGFGHSVNAALEGIVHALKSERNMRVHFLVGFLVLIAGIYFNFNFMEFMFLCFAVMFVLVAEMFNTAIEHAIDLISSDYNPLAKISKDIAAGAVFVSSVNAVIVGYILIVKRAGGQLGGIFMRIKQSPWHVTFITFLVVVGLVLAIKIIRREERLLRGGMPSGHSAVAFAVWIAVTVLTANALVSILVFLLALLIAKSRVGNGIHTLWEVIAGSVLGALISLLMFQVLM
ncbi:MAG: diacylglycerol kinase [Candidatus Tantalella remota]|nr:diacylglycerol kinase [Candidatus Tantalella remota]